MKSKFIEEFNIPEEDQEYIGLDIDYRSIAFEKFEGKEVCCEVCGITDVPKSSGGCRRQGFVVHHKDMRSSNDKYYHIDNRPENLLVLCPSCHSTIHQKGKVVSETTRRKMSESGRIKILSEEHKKKIGESAKGRIHSEETKRRISESLKGKSSKVKGRKWFNDGERSYMLYPDDKRCKDLNKGRLL